MNLDEEVYMEILKTLAVWENKTCWLVKYLYGLKYASRKLNTKITKELIQVGFIQFSYYSFFTKRCGIVFDLLVYVFDIVIIENEFTFQMQVSRKGLGPLEIFSRKWKSKI